MATAIGVGSSSNTDGVYVGRNTVCGTNGVAFGGFSNAFNKCTAVGYTSTALSVGSTAISISPEAGKTGTSNASIALGRSAKCHGDDSICSGNTSTIPSTTKIR